MTEADVIQIIREGFITALIICGPPLIAGTVTGLGIALFQALTQVQEMTLVFVPKIIAIFIALLIFLPLMGGLMSGFMTVIFDRISTP